MAGGRGVPARRDSPERQLVCRLSPVSRLPSSVRAVDPAKVGERKKKTPTENATSTPPTNTRHPRRPPTTTSKHRNPKDTTQRKEPPKTTQRPRRRSNKSPRPTRRRRPPPTPRRPQPPKQPRRRRPRRTKPPTNTQGTRRTNKPRKANNNKHNEHPQRKSNNNDNARRRNYCASPKQARARAVLPRLAGLPLARRAVFGVILKAPCVRACTTKLQTRRPNHEGVATKNYLADTSPLGSFCVVVV